MTTADTVTPEELECLVEFGVRSFCVDNSLPPGKVRVEFTGRELTPDSDVLCVTGRQEDIDDLKLACQRKFDDKQSANRGFL